MFYNSVSDSSFADSANGISLSVFSFSSDGPWLNCFTFFVEPENLLGKFNKSAGASGVCELKPASGTLTLYELTLSFLLCSTLLDGSSIGVYRSNSVLLWTSVATLTGKKEFCGSDGTG